MMRMPKPVLSAGLNPSGRAVPSFSTESAQPLRGSGANRTIATALQYRVQGARRRVLRRRKCNDLRAAYDLARTACEREGKM